MKRFHLTLLLVLVAALAVAGCTQQSNPNPILPSGDTNQSDNNAAAPGPNPITDIPSKGGLTVTVTDPDGALIANAVVEVFAGDDAAAQKIGLQNTDASGRTTFETVPVGEVYVTAADHDNLYQGNSADVRINADQTSLVSLQLSLRMPPPSENPNPDAVAVTLESDDAGFYQDGVQVTSIPVPNGAIVQLTINQRTANSVWGGADIRSTAFTSFNVPNGQTGTVSFQVMEPVTVSSYWPSSQVKKSDVIFTPQ
jgi:hypothetical protein